MPFVRVISENKIIEENVTENTNLVVQAGIKKFPYPYLKYKCGMGTCGTCASLIISGKNNLPEPTWKEVKVLKEMDFNLEYFKNYKLSLKIKDNVLSAYLENKLVLEYEDKNNLLDSGAMGLIVEDGTLVTDEIVVG